MLDLTYMYHGVRVRTRRQVILLGHQLYEHSHARNAVEIEVCVMMNRAQKYIQVQ